MPTYTVIDGEGYLLARGLSLRDAADMILCSDGRNWRIDETDDGRFRLYARHEVAGVKWGPTVFYSLKRTREAAETEIFERVVVAERMSGHHEAIEDSAYDRYLAETTGTEE